MSSKHSKGHSQQLAPSKLALLVAIIVVAAVVLASFLRGRGTDQQATLDEESVSEASQDSDATADEQGNQASEANLNPTVWTEWLNDEQKAELEIAYETSVGEGYEGSYDEWVAAEVKTRLSGNGNVVVTLPDGGEFTVIAANPSGDDQGAEPTAEDAADDEATDASNAQEPTGESPDDTESSDDGAQTTNIAPNEQSALISVGTVVAHKGDKRVALPIKILGNPGVLGLTFSVSYDESAVTLVAAENGEAFEGSLTLTRSRTFASGCLFTWDGMDIKPEQVKDGVILTLYFDISDGATGLHSVAVRGTSAFDADLNSVSLTTQDGSIVIE